MSDPDPSTAALSPGLASTSPEEVERVLHALLARREPLAALLGGGASSPWRLGFIDPARQYIVVEAVSDASVREVLLERERVTFVADFGGMNIEFTGERPQQIERRDAPAIRLGFPSNTVSRQRRAHPRAPLPPELPLHCFIPAGAGVALEAQIMDISRGGVGLLVRSSYLVPAPGTLIKGWRIERAGREPMKLDLEVRHSRPVFLPGGDRALRWGCQFIDPSDEARELIASFAKG